MNLTMHENLLSLSPIFLHHLEEMLHNTFSHQQEFDSALFLFLIYNFIKITLEILKILPVEHEGNFTILTSFSYHKLGRFAWYWKD